MKSKEKRKKDRKGKRKREDESVYLIVGVFRSIQA